MRNLLTDEHGDNCTFIMYYANRGGLNPNIFGQ